MKSQCSGIYIINYDYPRMPMRRIKRYGKMYSFLSYFFPITLEIVESEFSGQLEVVLSKGNYQLLTEKAIYSFGKKYENFSGLFERMDLKGFEAPNVLLLGLGLGSVITLLEEYLSAAQYLAVEIDESIVELAFKYELNDINNIETIIADATSAIHQIHRAFDIICVDIYVHDNIPAPILSKEYCEYLKSITKEGGVVIFNCPAFDKSHRILSNNYFENIFKTTYLKGQLLHIHKNYMLVSDNKYLKNR